MHNRFIALFIVSLVVILISGCSSKTSLKPDSPYNTAWMMKQAFDDEDYESFDDLFANGRRSTISKSEFNELSGMTTGGASYTNYMLVTFEDGGMLLVRLAPADETDRVAIEDVMVVTEEMEAFFQ